MDSKQETTEKSSDLIFKSSSTIEVREGDGKFVFDMKTRVESENEKAFVELSESFMKFIQQLTRR
jgi:hypothetical protein